MTSHFRAFVYASFVGLIIVAIFLGLLSSIGNPISWILIAALFLIPVIHDLAHRDDGVKWKDKYSVGVESLDNEHKKILQLLNNFKTAYDYAMSEEYERNALKELLDYTKYHFTTEEQMMEQHGYPELKSHKKEHLEMLEKIHQIEQRYEQVGHEAFEEVSDYLTHWLLQHICHSDKQYTEHLKSRGVS